MSENETDQWKQGREGEITAGASLRNRNPDDESLMPASKTLSFVMHFKVFALINCAISSKASKLSAPHSVSNQCITSFA